MAARSLRRTGEVQSRPERAGAETLARMVSGTGMTARRARDDHSEGLGVCAAETAKPYLTQARTSTNFDLRPDSTRARTPECPRSRRPHSLRRTFLAALRSACVSHVAIGASRLDGWIR